MGSRAPPILMNLLRRVYLALCCRASPWAGQTWEQARGPPALWFHRPPTPQPALSCPQEGAQQGGPQLLLLPLHLPASSPAEPGTTPNPFRKGGWPCHAPQWTIPHSRLGQEAGPQSPPSNTSPHPSDTQLTSPTPQAPNNQVGEGTENQASLCLPCRSRHTLCAGQRGGGTGAPGEPSRPPAVNIAGPSWGQHHRTHLCTPCKAQEPLSSLDCPGPAGGGGQRTKRGQSGRPQRHWDRSRRIRGCTAPPGGHWRLQAGLSRLGRGPGRERGCQKPPRCPGILLRAAELG